MTEPLADDVREVLAGLGSDPGPVQLRKLTGGASREVFLVEAESGNGLWALRRDPPGSRSFQPIAVEYAAAEAVVARGVSVPRPLHLEPEGGAFGSAGYLMEHVAGESVAPRLLKKPEFETARGALATDLGRALAGTHAVDPSEVAGIEDPPGPPAEVACKLWEEEIDRIGEPMPAVEAGLRWLRLNLPPDPPARSLVHGDFRLGNFIVDGDGLAAVIDWELCHGGDPVEDIGWLVIRSWRFGNDDLPVGGIGRIEELLDAYEEAGGNRPSAEALRWWEVMGNVKWAVICARQATDHLDGSRPSHELASLGRRICEPEWDLLQIIQGIEAG